MHLATIFTLAPGYARPVWHSAVRVGVLVCGCEGLSLAAKERARMTRVQLFEIHFNIILAIAGTGRALLVPSHKYCRVFLRFACTCRRQTLAHFIITAWDVTPCSMVTN